MQKCDFNKVALQLTEIALLRRCSPVNLLHIFRISFPKKISGRLLLSARIHSGHVSFLYPLKTLENLRFHENIFDYHN